MKKIFNKAIVWDYITSNPVLKVKSPGVSKKEKEEEVHFKYNKIKDYIESAYPMFNNINTNNINLTNVWDWLEVYKSKCGNEFIILPIG